VTHDAHTLERSEGVEIHWEARGEGPTVAIAHHSLWSYPDLYHDLIDDLARDHRVVVYDPRGCGQSSRSGPYDVDTDAADFEAVVEAAGGAALGLSVGEGLNRTVRVAAARPDLVPLVFSIVPGAAAVLPRSELEGSGVMAASDSVIDMMRQLMNTDPRSALRMMVAAVNPDLGEEELRERMARITDYLTPEATTNRANAWLVDDVTAYVEALGDRIWIVHGGPDPLFEGALRARVAELFPKAALETFEDGPITRPDLTAAWVRRLTKTGQ
jgi:pimeloyl-ACP methyl ester carboxylesterase